MYHPEVNKYQDIIDSRDVIARIEELEGDIQDLIDEGYDGTDDVTEMLEELDILKAFAEEGADNISYWENGATLVRDTYFEDYAQELADDIGANIDDVKWPLTCIDWTQAAKELQYDYSVATFDGVDYWGLSS